MNPRVPLTIAALAASPLVWGVEIDVRLQHTSEYTTNTTQTANNEIDEWIHQPGVDFNTSHNGPIANIPTRVRA